MLRSVRPPVWSQVVALYDQLVRLDPSPIIALNRGIAVAELDGPEVALAGNTAETAYLTRRRDQLG
jgi:RNA polymerase sigma-70 factor, ECF subfamily